MQECYELNAVQLIVKHQFTTYVVSRHFTQKVKSNAVDVNIVQWKPSYSRLAKSIYHQIISKLVHIAILFLKKGHKETALNQYFCTQSPVLSTHEPTVERKVSLLTASIRTWLMKCGHLSPAIRVRWEERIVPKKKSSWWLVMNQKRKIHTL